HLRASCQRHDCNSIDSGTTATRSSAARLQLDRSNHHLGMTPIAVEEPRSGRLGTADADLPSLSYGHLVGDSTDPAQRGKEKRPCRLRGPAFASPWRSGGLTPAIRRLLLARGSRLTHERRAAALGR